MPSACAVRRAVAIILAAAAAAVMSPASAHEPGAPWLPPQRDALGGPHWRLEPIDPPPTTLAPERFGAGLKPAQPLGLARGTLLRLQIDASTSLSLRLRGGGLALAWRSEF